MARYPYNAYCDSLQAFALIVFGLSVKIFEFPYVKFTKLSPIQIISDHCLMARYPYNAYSDSLEAFDLIVIGLSVKIFEFPYVKFTKLSLIVLIFAKKLCNGPVVSEVPNYRDKFTTIPV